MLEQIIEILVSTANIDRTIIREDSSLRDDLHIDSLDSVEIMLEIETQFNIQIEDEEIVNLVTIKDIVDLIERKNN